VRWQLVAVGVSGNNLQVCPFYFYFSCLSFGWGPRLEINRMLGPQSWGQILLKKYLIAIVNTATFQLQLQIQMLYFRSVFNCIANTLDKVLEGCIAYAVLCH